MEDVEIHGLINERKYVDVRFEGCGVGSLVRPNTDATRLGQEPMNPVGLSVLRFSLVFSSPKMLMLFSRRFRIRFSHCQCRPRAVMTTSSLAKSGQGSED